jgi:hypothetical protein
MLFHTRGLIYVDTNKLIYKAKKKLDGEMPVTSEMFVDFVGSIMENPKCAYLSPRLSRLKATCESLL